MPVAADASLERLFSGYSRLTTRTSWNCCERRPRRRSSRRRRPPSGARHSYDRERRQTVLELPRRTRAITAPCRLSEPGRIPSHRRAQQQRTCRYVVVEHAFGRRWKYLGECKIHRGYQYHVDGCEQLLRYCTGRELRAFCMDFFNITGAFGEGCGTCAPRSTSIARSPKLARGVRSQDCWGLLNDSSPFVWFKHRNSAPWVPGARSRKQALFVGAPHRTA